MSFSEMVDEWARESRLRLNTVYRQSVQDLVNEVQTPRPKGGNMPVDTGFLRNSGQLKNGELPRGESKNRGQLPEFAPAAVSAVLLTAEADDTLYFGWTAEYAPFMNARYQFVDLAAQNWPQIVRRANQKVKR